MMSMKYKQAGDQKHVQDVKQSSAGGYSET